MLAIQLEQGVLEEGSFDEVENSRGVDPHCVKRRLERSGVAGQIDTIEW
ncbi:hypothetical protein GGD41_002644 [Paraburkholderia bryophila]|uniref:Uncharacterized protein n=1 Tax=Paraburkholderia bryophila TaxID=420952 RepID=A0A7Y9W717_9BURK|nr:hypothetical protein [Paraburkholderia bryophila]NYH26283.1 hypothetical protein [Paraburkholderia bryophila]